MWLIRCAPANMLTLSSCCLLLGRSNHFAKGFQSKQQKKTHHISQCQYLTITVVTNNSTIFPAGNAPAVLLHLPESGKKTACLICVICKDANQSLIIKTFIPIILILPHYSPPHLLPPPPFCWAAAINERCYERVDASVE